MINLENHETRKTAQLIHFFTIQIIEEYITAFENLSWYDDIDNIKDELLDIIDTLNRGQFLSNDEALYLIDELQNAY